MSSISTARTALALALAVIAGSACDSRSVHVTVDEQPGTRPATTLVVRVSDTTGSSAPTHFDLPIDYAGQTTFVIAADGRAGDLGVELALCDGDRAVAAATGISASGDAEVSLTLEPLDFQVNSTYEGAQIAPVGGALAVGDDNSFLIAWDGDEGGLEARLRARLFGPNTAPWPHAVSQETTDFIVSENFLFAMPSVARVGDIYLQAWQASEGGASTIDVVSDVWASDGTGGQFERLVNETPAQQIKGPHVAPVGTDRFAITWAQMDSGASLFRAHYRVTSSTGTAVTDDVAVQAPAGSELQASRVATLEDGSFVIMWNELPEAEDPAVFAQVYDASGLAMGSRIEVERLTEGIDQSELAITGVPGGFAVVWTINYGEEARFRAFTKAGAPMSEAKTIAATPGGSVGSPDISVLSDGILAFTWTKSGMDIGDTTAWLRTTTADGATMSEPIRLSAVSAQNVQTSTVRAFGDRGLLAVWSDQLNTDDTTGSGIRARLLYPPYAVEPTPSLPCMPGGE